MPHGQLPAAKGFNQAALSFQRIYGACQATGPGSCSVPHRWVSDQESGAMALSSVLEMLHAREVYVDAQNGGLLAAPSLPSCVIKGMILPSG